MLHVPEVEPESPRTLSVGIDALFRMKETARRGPRILEDRFAAKLADEPLLVQALRLGRFALPAVRRAVAERQAAHCVQHRAIDELVLRAVGDGFRQVVAVGAGYDMRPTRFSERIGDVRWYELERRDISERKRRRLGRALVRPYESGVLHLDGKSLGEMLATTSFDPDWDTLFVLEGLVQHLTLPQLTTLLGDIGHGRGRRRLVMTVPSVGAASPGADLFGRALDEGPGLRVTPGHLSALCARARLHHFMTWSYEQQVNEFAPEAADRPVSATHDLAQVERTR
jgi:methyltransferase (TIGR00027 family)